MIALLTLNQTAIRHNIQTLRRIVAPARVAAVVKANAYGHGLIPVAEAALAGGAARLCVYHLEEALALRAAGITARIQVLGPIAPSDLTDAHSANVEATLWDEGMYLADLRAAAHRGGAPFAVHGKIDTGTTRFGLPLESAPAALARYVDMPELRLVGVASHLAAAEELAGSYTIEQTRRFASAVAAVPPGAERHLAASAAALLWPSTRFDGIRAGIAIYGIWPSPATRHRLAGEGIALIPALRWTTTVAAMRDVAAETPVGYGCDFVTSRPSRIAVLPIGYAEVIPRAASSASSDPAAARAHVLIGGRRCPIVGRVCMNVTFVDTSDVPAGLAHPGATVTLIGTDGDTAIDAADWGAWCGTIGYEIVARLPATIPRVTIEASLP